MDIQKAYKRYIPMSETMFYILLSLQQERHGYGIMQHVKEITNDRIILGAGTIYQSIGKLYDDELIIPVNDDSRRKTYIITELGMYILKEEAKRIKEIYKNMEGLI